MHVVIAGGSGALGHALTARLVADGHSVVVLSRQPSSPSPRPGVRQTQWSPDGSAGEWARALGDADAVVNLAGAGIADARWTRARKALLRSSRVLSTRSLVTAIRNLPARPKVFIQHSAVGYYGSTLDSRELDESFPPGDDFLGQLALAWEAEASPVTTLGCRLVTIRGGIVLQPDRGPLPKMARPFRFFVGGPIASGRQYISWIHIDDWTALMIWALTGAAVSGVVNATAPGPATSREFSGALGRAMHRPSWAPVPAFVLRILFGEMADAALVRGQRVVPRRALDLGFVFRHPTIDEALEDLLSGR